MLIVISDLHLEEESSRNIVSDDPNQPDIILTRNVSPRAFRKIFGQWDKQAERANAQTLDLVLAGDIFDLHRTAIWFQGPDPSIRPYTSANPSEVTKPLEQRIIDILDATNTPNSQAHQILGMFRELKSSGTYTDENNDKCDFSISPDKINIHYLPGNHDRLANGTSKTRRKVRQLIGCNPSSVPFPNEISFVPEKTLVRHGHEYDRYNFSTDLRPFLKKNLPLTIPYSAYAKPTVGDFVTIDIASRLSHEFRQQFGDKVILQDKRLRAAYERIVEFDDLRPQLAALSYLLHISQEANRSETIWKTVYAPVLLELLENIHDDPFLKESLKQLDTWAIDEIDLIQLALLTQSIWKGLATNYGLVKWLAEMATKRHHGNNKNAPEHYAALEETILDGTHRFLVAGHTHKPTVEFIGKSDGSNQFYVNTGTWRRRIFTNRKNTAFGQVKALTYAIIYGPEEDLGGITSEDQVKTVSLDFWSGVTQRWFS